MSKRIASLDFGTCPICRCQCHLAPDGTIARHISQAQQGFCRGSLYPPMAT